MDSILIVKTSAIGDVVQTFGVLEYLRSRFPNARIDWVVEKGASSLLLAHPYLSHVKIIDSKKWRKNILGKQSREEISTFLESLQSHSYDVLFDLQGNTKSGLIDFFCRAKDKVGFGSNCVAEKPNLLFTNKKYEIDPNQSIYSFYLSLVQSYLGDRVPFQAKGVRLKVSSQESERLKETLQLPQLQRPLKLMVALGSNWENKRLSKKTAEELLSLIQENTSASFVIVYANEIEKEKARALVEKFPSQALAIGEMSLPFWGALMTEMDGVISMDSAALHLAAAAGVPTFSLFGPSSSFSYKPQGAIHVAVQGACPYGLAFTKRCPQLRTCKTGACLKDLKAEQLFESFRKWSLTLSAAKVH